jgi:hypothetical protein
MDEESFEIGWNYKRVERGVTGRQGVRCISKLNLGFARNSDSSFTPALVV